MANETNFQFTDLVVYKETTENTIPANPKGLVVSGVINCTLKDTQKTETSPTLSAGGQASKKDRGSSDFAGNIECKTMGDIMPFVVTHVLGDATKTNVTAEAWVTLTLYAPFNPYTLVGDILAHTDGIHDLVCKVGGTSGATIPSMVGLSSGDTIVDGTVTWIVRNKLKKYVGESEPCLKTFGAEFSADAGCGSASTFKKRFGGNFLNSYEISKASGTIIHKYSLPVVAMSGTDNVVDTAFASIKDAVGYTSQTLQELPFKYDDLMVQVGGVEPVNGRSFRMMVNRNVALVDAVAQNIKVSNIPQMTVEGEISLKFTKEQYLSAYNNDSAVVKALFGKINGDIAHFTFNYVEKDRVDPDFSTNEPAYLTIPLTASGDNVTKTISYTVYSETDY